MIVHKFQMICGHCGFINNEASGLPGYEDNAGPAPGSIMLCFKCTGVNIVNEDLTCRKLEAEEWVDLPADVRRDIRRAQQITQEIKEKNHVEH